MDPMDLTCDELDYELMIRNVYDRLSENNRAKSGRLRELLVNEKAGRIPSPSNNISPFDPNHDIVSCSATIRQIRESFQELPLEKPRAKYLYSRATHAFDRLKRIQTNEREEQDKKALLIAEIEIQLYKLREIVNTPSPKLPRRRNTVTDDQAPQLEISRHVAQSMQSVRSMPSAYQRELSRPTIYDTHQQSPTPLPTGTIPRSLAQFSTVTTSTNNKPISSATMSQTISNAHRSNEKVPAVEAHNVLISQEPVNNDLFQDRRSTAFWDLNIQPITHNQQDQGFLNVSATPYVSNHNENNLQMANENAQNRVNEENNRQGAHNKMVGNRQTNEPKVQMRNIPPRYSQYQYEPLFNAPCNNVVRVSTQRELDIERNDQMNFVREQIPNTIQQNEYNQQSNRDKLDELIRVQRTLIDSLLSQYVNQSENDLTNNDLVNNLLRIRDGLEPNKITKPRRDNQTASRAQGQNNQRPPDHINMAPITGTSSANQNTNWNNFGPVQPRALFDQGNIVENTPMNRDNPFNHNGEIFRLDAQPNIFHRQNNNYRTFILNNIDQNGLPYDNNNIQLNRNNLGFPNQWGQHIPPQNVPANDYYGTAQSRREWPQAPTHNQYQNMPRSDQNRNTSKSVPIQQWRMFSVGIPHRKTMSTRHINF